MPGAAGGAGGAERGSGATERPAAGTGAPESRRPASVSLLHLGPGASGSGSWPRSRMLRTAPTLLPNSSASSPYPSNPSPAITTPITTSQHQHHRTTGL